MGQIKLSSKGQIVLPKAVRDHHGWGKGTEIMVDDRADEIVLRTARLFPPTEFEPPDAPSIHDGPPLTIEDMDRAVAKEVSRRR